jgi:hypothetical protein
LQKFSEDLRNNDMIEVKAEKTINSANVIVYGEGGMCGYKNAFIFGNNVSVKFWSHCGYDDPALSKLFDQILSTFKFTK